MVNFKSLFMSETSPPGLYVLEIENPRSEFLLESKILFFKSTPGNTKITSELNSNGASEYQIGKSV